MNSNDLCFETLNDKICISFIPTNDVGLVTMAPYTDSSQVEQLYNQIQISVNNQRNIINNADYYTLSMINNVNNQLRNLYSDANNIYVSNESNDRKLYLLQRLNDSIGRVTYNALTRSV